MHLSRAYDVADASRRRPRRWQLDTSDASLEKIFAEMDADSSGKVSEEEMKGAKTHESLKATTEDEITSGKEQLSIK